MRQRRLQIGLLSGWLLAASPGCSWLVLRQPPASYTSSTAPCGGVLSALYPVTDVVLGATSVGLGAAATASMSSRGESAAVVPVLLGAGMAVALGFSAAYGFRCNDEARPDQTHGLVRDGAGPSSAPATPWISTCSVSCPDGTVHAVPSRTWTPGVPPGDPCAEIWDSTLSELCGVPPGQPRRCTACAPWTPDTAAK
jgi:hypothetical protein